MRPYVKLLWPLVHRWGLESWTRTRVATRIVNLGLATCLRLACIGLRLTWDLTLGDLRLALVLKLWRICPFLDNNLSLAWLHEWVRASLYPHVVHWGGNIISVFVTLRTSRRTSTFFTLRASLVKTNLRHSASVICVPTSSKSTANDKLISLPAQVQPCVFSCDRTTHNWLTKDCFLKCNVSLYWIS